MNETSCCWHFPAKAKSVIWLFMNGGPSQVDTWDYKPELARRDVAAVLIPALVPAPPP